MFRFLCLISILSLLLSSSAQAAGPHSHDGINVDRPDGHAPIGVMGDHRHALGEWMLSYRFMAMEMEGNRSGSSSMSTDDVFTDGFMVAPKRMTMQMHMFGGMTALTDATTVAMMVPYKVLNMELVTRNGREFSTETDGIGDLKIATITELTAWGNSSLNLNLGISLPTGSIDETDDTPMGPDRHLAYPMQLGSGTFDLYPGLTLINQSDSWSWGAQLNGIARLGRNSEGYSLGDEVSASLWGAVQATEWASASLRLRGRAWADVDGEDDRVNPRMMPGADPDRRNGERLELLVGINLLAPSGALKGHRLGIEVGVPIYEHLDGPQLEQDWVITLGWQKTL